MEQQYQRLPLATPDLETPNDLEKDADCIYSEGCVRCGARTSKGNSINPWQICFTLSFGLLASTVLVIWIWGEILSPRSVVPDSGSKLRTLFYKRLT
jgi:hypothetical protein